MKAARALLVLLFTCLSEVRAQGDSGGSASERGNGVEPATLLNPDLWTELEKLRGMVLNLGTTVVDMRAETRESLSNMEGEVEKQRGMVNNLGATVVEQRQSLSNVEGEVKEQKAMVNNLGTTVVDMTAETRESLSNMEGEVEKQGDSVIDLRLELGITKYEMERMAKENAEMAAKLSAGEKELEDLQARLSSSESSVEVLETRLSSSESSVEALKKDSQEIAAKLSAAEKEREDLQARLSSSETEVQVLQTRLNTTDDQVQVLETSLGSMGTTDDQVQVLETRLSSSESSVEALKKESEAQLARLSSVENRLADTDNKVSSVENRLADTDNKVSSVENRLADTDNKVQELWNKPQIAFSVGLGSGYVGPFGSQTTLVYKKVFTNMGNAYNPSTGRPGGDKNDQELMYNSGYNNHGQMESISNGMILELEEGDTVYMMLPNGYRLFDNSFNHSTWSGVLVYSM